MQDHYKTLGISTAATPAEIRRAYRILARRYHPDVNPGTSTTVRKFREISEAYAILSNPNQRARYDQIREARDGFTSAFDTAHKAYRKRQDDVKPASPKNTPPGEEKRAPKAPPRPEKPRATPPPPPPPAPEPPPPAASLTINLSRLREKAFPYLKRAQTLVHDATKRIKKKTVAKEGQPTVTSLSLIEVSISVFDSITGIRKSIEVPVSADQHRKVSLLIPPGVREGSLVRVRGKEDPSEEFVAIIRIAHHPWVAITHRGLTLEIPITIAESISGAKVQIPSLGDPLLVKVEPGTQSGTEVRLKGQGVHLSDGSRGDLFVRFLIKSPDKREDEGCVTKASELTPFYSADIRASLPRSLIEPKEV